MEHQLELKQIEDLSPIPEDVLEYLEGVFCRPPYIPENTFEQVLYIEGSRLVVDTLRQILDYQRNKPLDNQRIPYVS